MSREYQTDLQLVAEHLAALVEQQRLANLIAARNSGVRLTRSQLECIESFVRNQVGRIEAGI